MMSDIASRGLWCLIEGDSTPFRVTAPVTANINHLKELVHEKGINKRTRILAKDLVLWKVRHRQGTNVRALRPSGKLKTRMVIRPSRSLSQRIQSLGTNLSDFANELDKPTEEVSKLWLAQPINDGLHIFVKDPDAGEWGALFPPMRSADSSLPSCIFNVSDSPVLHRYCATDQLYHRHLISICYVTTFIHRTTSQLFALAPYCTTFLHAIKTRVIMHGKNDGRVSG